MNRQNIEKERQLFKLCVRNADLAIKKRNKGFIKNLDKIIERTFEVQAVISRTPRLTRLGGQNA